MGTKKAAAGASVGGSAKPDKVKKLPREFYEKTLYRLQGELVTMQEWVKSTGARIVVVFEGRDAAGKGSTIKRGAAHPDGASAHPVVLPAVRRAVARCRGDRALRPILVQPSGRGARHGLLYR